MGKKKAITSLIFILVFVLIFGVLAVTSFSIGKYDYKAPISNIPLGIELSGGVYVVFDANVPQDKEGNALYDESELSQNIDGTIKVLQDRLLAAGYSEATVVTSGNNQIRVEVADIGTQGLDVDAIFDIIGKPAVLEFRTSDGEVILSGNEGHIKKAVASYDSQTLKYFISLEFSKEGTELFAKATADNVGKSIGIYLDDDQLMNPTVESAITDGRAMISGNFTREEVVAYTAQIQGGALKVDLTVSEQNSVSATLGLDAVKTSIIAGIIGLILVFIFMAVYYRGLGLIADIALLIYIIIVIFLLGTLPLIQLSLAGIAGIILSIGMAVDANVVIFERIKDEYRLGKNIPASIQAGFKRASRAIFDANITTIIACAVLYFLGSATIKSFAITLFIGIVVSFFTAMLVTRNISNVFVGINNTNNKFYNLKAEVKSNEKA